MCGFGDTVLLECTINRVSGELDLLAEWLIGLLAERTGKTSPVDPLTSNVLATKMRLSDRCRGKDMIRHNRKLGDKGKWAVRERERERERERRTLTPALSPISMSVTKSPRATTIPAPSWPPTRGSFVSSGQSPLRAWRSVWQTPEYLMLTNTSSGPGFCTGICLYSTGPPVFSIT